MCSSPKMPKQNVPAPAPRLMDEGASRARDDEKRRLRMLRGRQSTILTGNTGLSAPTTTATLLGGG